MPVEAKPLFRPDVIARHTRAFSLPDRVEALAGKLRNWKALIQGSQFTSFREQELLPDFLSDIFGSLLGYSGPASGGARYTLSREKHVEVEGEFVDAVLGEFGGAIDRPVVAVEGKGPRDPLERPHGGRRLSAVEQAYRYATNLPCDWIVVTNLKEIRLYHKGSDQRTYERFEPARFSADEDHLRRFVFLLGAERVAPEAGEGHLPHLLTASARAELDLTRQFYTVYATTRFDLLEQLRKTNPGVEPERLLGATQKLLDRVLFCAFAEDRGLLPPETLKQAYETRNPYNPQPVWENFRGLFQSIDRGNPTLRIPAYDGGLFEPDDFLDALSVPDDVCAELKEIGDYDYRAPEQVVVEEADTEPLVDVDILGHIFEQSITDLEQIRSDLAAGDPEMQQAKKEVSRRKREGAYYTPAHITRYIVRETLEPVIAERFEKLRSRHQDQAKGTAPAVLEDPWVYDLEEINEPQRKALVRFWEACLDELQTVRLLDPACGSGAFLIEAFDQFHLRYQEINERLTELRRGEASLFDADRTILRENLYGVDLNGEAVQIARLSVWIKTAQRGKELTDLDETIRVGNSIIEDPGIDPRALDWKSAFPEVFEDGGFDAVVGNPPYVRQELLGELKPYLQDRYSAYHGMADLYVYFFERGLDVLRPGGRLSVISTNKWMKAGYGAPLRRLFSATAWVESVVDFGHAKQIFEDADVFPSIVVLKKPRQKEKATRKTRVSVIPRESLRLSDLRTQVDEEGFELPTRFLEERSWRLEPPAVQELLAKVRVNGTPLKDYSGVIPYRGVVTGYNRAFLVDTPTRQRLISEDPNSGEIIKPYLSGKDLRRWAPAWAGVWMIFSSRDIDIHRYPAVLRYLRSYQRELQPRPPDWDQTKDGRWPGRKPGKYRWYEIQDTVAYWQLFEEPKIIYPDIVWRPSFSLDRGGHFTNNTVYFLPTSDPWLLAVLNSSLVWWFSWRAAQHGKDDALRLFNTYMESFPVAAPGPSADGFAEFVEKVTAYRHKAQEQERALLDWLRVEHDIDKPGRTLESPFELSSDEFVEAVRKRRGKTKLSSAALKSLREEYAATVEPMRQRLAEAAELERQLSSLVNEAYGLTEEEVDLMWRTAPPRMPVAGPG